MARRAESPREGIDNPAIASPTHGRGAARLALRGYDLRNLLGRFIGGIV
jgi:hypothetical protein